MKECDNSKIECSGKAISMIHLLTAIG